MAKKGDWCHAKFWDRGGNVGVGVKTWDWDGKWCWEENRNGSCDDMTWKGDSVDEEIWD